MKLRASVMFNVPLVFCIVSLLLVGSGVAHAQVAAPDASRVPDVTPHPMTDTALRQQRPTDGHSADPWHWVSGFGLPTVQGWVRELVEDEAGVLYAAGSFDVFGAIKAYNVARWDGHVWSALGAGLDGSVSALALDRDGNLYAAGAFTHAGAVAANHIARWDGAHWTALGTGLNDVVRALAFDEAGHVYAGGEFTYAGGLRVNHVAKWDGATWSALGDGVPGQVWALADDGQGNLYAAQQPVVIVNDRYGDVRQWDGETWTTLSGAVNSWIDALAVDSAGNLYAGGEFTKMGGATMPYIARWDGTTWAVPGGGLDGMVNELEADAQGNIYATGEFLTAGGVPVTYVARWDGSHWQAVGDKLPVYAGEHLGVYALSVTSDAHVSIRHLSTFYQLQDGAWQSLPIPGNGMFDWVTALGKDGGGQLYAGGRFWHADSIRALHIAHWDGAQWQALGEGLNGDVGALVTDDQGILYAGGAFTATGQISLPRIARWDGQSWSPLGGGVDDDVVALVTDHAGNLYAGGYFESAGGVTAHHVAKWDGEQWTALGNGLNTLVSSLVIGPDGTLYAGGWFDDVITVDGQTERLNGVARWDGQQWRGLDDGLTEPAGVDALAIDGAGNLYAGGIFTRISHGNSQVHSIARWDGERWQTLGSGLVFDSPSSYPTWVSALAVDSQGILYAGGLFNRAGGQPANYIARWDGDAWTALGEGVDGPATQWFNWIYALALLDDARLFAGGHFDTAGGLPSANIALWSGQTPSPTATPTPTATLTPTATPAPTITLTPTVTALYLPLIQHRP